MTPARGAACRFATMKFPANFAKKVDMRRVHVEVLRPWVAKKG